MEDVVLRWKPPCVLKLDQWLSSFLYQPFIELPVTHANDAIRQTEQIYIQVANF